MKIEEGEGGRGVPFLLPAPPHLPAPSPLLLCFVCFQDGGLTRSM